MNETLTMVASVLAATLRMSVPLGFAAIGGAISEKSGVIALGLEGYMTIGALFAVLGSYWTGSAGLGLLFAALAGGLFAAVYALMSVRFKANQTVAGLGMNIMAPGLVAVLMVTIFGNKGKSEVVAGLAPIELPFVKNIPFVGQILSGHTILFYLLIVVAVAAWVMMYKTPAGMRLRSTGTNPEVIDSLGLGADKIKYIAAITAGVLAGIGGAYLSIGRLNFYSNEMVAGRGFIAIAVFVFAKWNPIWCLWVAMLFGFTDAIQMRLQAFEVPSQLVQMIPYLCTLLVLVNIRNKKRRHSMM